MLSSVWVLNEETDVCGVWSTPEKAVRARFGVDDDGMVELSWSGPKMTLEAAVTKMTAPNSDYPYLTEVTIDSDKPWSRDV